jgi:Zn-dependent protease
MEPSPTPFDLRWRMFGIDVRVHPLFWIVTAALGWPRQGEGFKFLLLWMVCVFVSILIHELGHVFMGRLFGSDGHIVLYGFGGLAIGSSLLERRWQRILVYFAGPLAGFVFLGLVTGVYFAFRLSRTGEHIPPGLEITFWFLVWINLVWGAVNLLPIWPLDGGQISRDLLDGLMPQIGNKVAMGISAGVAGLVAIAAGLLLHDLYLALFFGFLAFSSIQAMQYFTAARPGYKEPDSWERDRDPGDNQ